MPPTVVIMVPLFMVIYVEKKYTYIDKHESMGRGMLETRFKTIINCHEERFDPYGNL